MPDASDRICAVVFGNKMPNEIVSHPNYPEWIENKLTIFNYDSDENLHRIEKMLKPNVYVTFGNWKLHKNLSGAHFDIRKKWINFSIESSVESVAENIYSAYKKSCFIPLNEKYPLVSVITPPDRDWETK